MATRKLRIFFSGLCAITPGGPIGGKGEKESDGPLTIVMPASRPRTSVNHPNYTIPVHLPFIAAPAGLLISTGDPDRRLESYDIENEALGRMLYRVWLLYRERITFTLDGEKTWPIDKIYYTQTQTKPGVSDHWEPLFFGPCSRRSTKAM